MSLSQNIPSPKFSFHDMPGVLVVVIGTVNLYQWQHLRASPAQDLSYLNSEFDLILCICVKACVINSEIKP